MFVWFWCLYKEVKDLGIPTKLQEYHIKLNPSSSLSLTHTHTHTHKDLAVDLARYIVDPKKKRPTMYFSQTWPTIRTDIMHNRDI